MGQPDDADTWDEDRIRRECSIGTVRELQAYLRAGYVLKPDMYPFEAAEGLVCGTATNVSGRDVVEYVCKKRNVTAQAVLGRSHRRELVFARREIVFVCYRKLGKSMAEIAKIINRDHSTCSHLLATYEGTQKKFTYTEDGKRTYSYDHRPGIEP